MPKKIGLESLEIPLLEPKIVSSWLGIPGSQLPRETMKIIGQPEHPAKKKGGSGRYSGEDAILLKFGRKLIDLGITPHRVQICVRQVRKRYHEISMGKLHLYRDAKNYETVEGPFYLVGRETSEGFETEIVVEKRLAEWLTESGLEILNLRQERDQILWDRGSGGDDTHNEERPKIYGNFDPGSPAIVQNVSRFVQDSHRLLLMHVLEFKTDRT